MFSLPVPMGEILEGSTNEKPIFLPGIKAQEFKLLLGVLFTRLVGYIVHHTRRLYIVLQRIWATEKSTEEP